MANQWKKPNVQGESKRVREKQRNIKYGNTNIRAPMDPKAEIGIILDIDVLNLDSTCS